MLSMRSVLARNEPKDYLPYNAGDYIQAITPDVLTDENIEQFEKAFSHAQILLNEDMREIFIKSLRENECRELIARLELTTKQNEDPWTFLINKLNIIEERLYYPLFKIFDVDTAPLTEYLSNRSDLDQEQTINEDSEQIVKPMRSLFEHQREALLELEYNFFLRQYPKYRALLHMPTGSGKTRTAAMFACRYLLRHDNGLVVWLADTKELCDQAYEELKTSWVAHGDRAVNFARAYASHHPEWGQISTGIFVLSLQTANRNQKKVQNLARFEPLVIFDEAHKTTATTYLDTVSNLLSDHMSGRRSRLLGLSATPGRSTLDELKNSKLINAYDSCIVNLHINGYGNPVDFLIDHGYLARANFIRIKSSFDFIECCKSLKIDPHKSKKFSSSDIDKISQRMADDKERNALIFQTIVELIEKKNHKRILVFAASVIQGLRLAIMLRFFGYDAMALASNTNPHDRQRIIEDYKKPRLDAPKAKIICNYNILTTGFDAPQTSAVVIARPTNSLILYSQMVGRALRGPRAGGNPSADVVTVIDNNLPAFWDVQAAFIHWDKQWNN